MKKTIMSVMLIFVMMFSMTATSFAACRTYRSCPTCGKSPSRYELTYKRQKCKKARGLNRLIYGKNAYMCEQHVTAKCTGTYQKKSWGRYKTYNCKKKYLNQCNIKKHEGKYNHVY